MCARTLVGPLTDNMFYYFDTGVHLYTYGYCHMLVTVVPLIPTTFIRLLDNFPGRESPLQLTVGE